MRMCGRAPGYQIWEITSVPPDGSNNWKVPPLVMVIKHLMMLWLTSIVVDAIITRDTELNEHIKILVLFELWIYIEKVLWIQKLQMKHCSRGFTEAERVNRIANKWFTLAVNHDTKTARQHISPKNCWNRFVYLFAILWLLYCFLKIFKIEWNAVIWRKTWISKNPRQS